MNNSQLVVGSKQSIKLSIDELTAKVSEAFERATTSASIAVNDAIECGRWLFSLRENIPHGGWHPTLATIGIPPRTASQMLKYFEHRDLIVQKSATTWTQADQLIKANRQSTADLSPHSEPCVEKLSPNESVQWQTQLAVIESCRDSHRELINAIGVIRNLRLYREQYLSFEDFVNDKLSDFGFGGLRNMNKLIAASLGRRKIASKLTESDAKKFDKTSRLVAFADVPDAEIARIASKSIALAGDKEPTVKQIKIAKESVTVEPPSRLRPKTTLAEQLRAILVQMPEAEAMEVVHDVFGRGVA